MKIQFHIGTGGPNYPWLDLDPAKIGIGGSEEALSYMKRELEILGHQVTAIQSRFSGSLNYLEPGQHLDCDIFIAWRDWRLYEQAPVGSKRYLWCHDIPVEPHWDHEAALHFDRIILLNEHHARLYEAAGCPREKMFIASNGVDLAQFDQQVLRVPGKCIYFSHPHRGLHKLREYWPKIRAAVPHATLNAFWWEDGFFLPPDESLGIMPMRSLGHEELAREILSSDCLTYPSVFDHEINPITCIKSQVGGAWPVTVNCGGMADTLQFGDSTDHAGFAEEVILRLQTSPTHGFSRREMIRLSRERYDWRNISRLWESEFLQQLQK